MLRSCRGVATTNSMCGGGGGGVASDCLRFGVAGAADAEVRFFAPFRCGRYTYPGCSSACSRFRSFARSSHFARSAGERAFHCWEMVLLRSAWRCFWGFFPAPGLVGVAPEEGDEGEVVEGAEVVETQFRRNKMNAFSGRFT